MNFDANKPSAFIRSCLLTLTLSLISSYALAQGNYTSGKVEALNKLIDAEGQIGDHASALKKMKSINGYQQNLLYCKSGVVNTLAYDKGIHEAYVELNSAPTDDLKEKWFVGSIYIFKGGRVSLGSSIEKESSWAIPNDSKDVVLTGRSLADRVTGSLEEIIRPSEYMKRTTNIPIDGYEIDQNFLGYFNETNKKDEFYSKFMIFTLDRRNLVLQIQARSNSFMGRAIGDYELFSKMNCTLMSDVTLNLFKLKSIVDDEKLKLMMAIESIKAKLEKERNDAVRTNKF